MLPLFDVDDEELFAEPPLPERELDDELESLPTSGAMSWSINTNFVFNWGCLAVISNEICKSKFPFVAGLRRRRQRERRDRTFAVLQNFQTFHSR